jgi:hypothetical protein
MLQQCVNGRWRSGRGGRRSRCEHHLLSFQPEGADRLASGGFWFQHRAAFGLETPGARVRFEGERIVPIRVQRERKAGCGFRQPEQALAFGQARRQQRQVDAVVPEVGLLGAHRHGVLVPADVIRRRIANAAGEQDGQEEDEGTAHGRSGRVGFRTV